MPPKIAKTTYCSHPGRTAVGTIWRSGIPTLSVIYQARLDHNVTIKKCYLSLGVICNASPMKVYVDPGSNV